MWALPVALPWFHGWIPSLTPTRICHFMLITVALLLRGSGGFMFVFFVFFHSAVTDVPIKIFIFWYHYHRCWYLLIPNIYLWSINNLVLWHWGRLGPFPNSKNLTVLPCCVSFFSMKLTQNKDVIFARYSVQILVWCIVFFSLFIFLEVCRQSSAFLKYP